MKKLLIVLISLVLAGCAAETKTVPIPDVKVLEIPDQMFLYPDIPAPPVTPDKYVTLSSEEKEKALSLYAVDLIKVIKDYRLIEQNIQNYVKDAMQKVNKIIKDNANGKPH